MDVVVENTRRGIKLEKSIEYLAYGMILLFYTGKVFQVFTVLIDILFLALLYLRQDKEFFHIHKKLLIIFGIFFSYLAVQSLMAVNSKAAFVNAVGMVRFVILFFALWYVFNSREKIKKLVYSVILAITLLFIDSVYQYFKGVDMFGHPSLHGFRLTAWDSNAKLGSFVAVLSGVAAASVFIVKERWLAVSGLIMLLLMVFFSGSKGPVVYLTGAVVVVFLVSATYRKYLIPALIVLGVIFTAVILTNDKIAARFEQFKKPLSPQNTSARVQIYSAAIEMIKDHPLLGVGTRNFRESFEEYYRPIYEQKKDKTAYDDIFIKILPTHVHSMLFSFLVNWGLIGTIIFFYILYYIYKKYVRHNEVALLASIGVVYCVAPFNFGNTIARSQWQFYIFLTLAFVVILGSYNKFREKKTGDHHEIG